MYCRNCGAEINDEASICIHCGVATHNYRTEKRESNPLALIGFILAFFSRIAGLICSIIAYRRCKENPELEGKNMALAGIIISAVALGIIAVVFVIWLIIFVSVMIGIGGSIPNNPELPEELACIFSLIIK